MKLMQPEQRANYDAMVAVLRERGFETEFARSDWQEVWLRLPVRVVLSRVSGLVIEAEVSRTDREIVRAPVHLVYRGEALASVVDGMMQS